MIACDQYPDHSVLAGEQFIATVYNRIRQNPNLWPNTALLIAYDQHGGTYDHVPPPDCTRDGFVAPPAATGTPSSFNFDRLGVRVPAILVSPWVARGTVINEVFEHASIPATVAEFFLGPSSARSPREIAANTFLNLVTLPVMRDDKDCPSFSIVDPEKPANSPDELLAVQTEASGTPRQTTKTRTRANKTSARSKAGAQGAVPSTEPIVAASHSSPPSTQFSIGPSTHVARDRWTTEDSLGHYPYAYAIYRFLTDPETKPPLAVSIQAPWGGGKSSLMRMIQSQLDPDAIQKIDQTNEAYANEDGSASVKNILTEISYAANPPAADAVIPSVSKASFWSSSSSRISDSKPAQPAVPVIEKPGERRVTVWFNAWKYESTAQVWA